MQTPDPDRSTAIRSALRERAAARLNESLAKITGTGGEAEKQRAKQRSFFVLDELLRDGAKHSRAIQMATHIVKGVHPDPKIQEATNLIMDCDAMPVHDCVGSNTLGENFETDATGNGAYNKRVFEAFRLLQAEFEGTSVLTLLKARDVDAISALSDDPKEAAEIAEKLADIDGSRCQNMACHGFVRQIYWPVGTNPHDDSDFHLLAPLYPASLVHRVYEIVQNDRFGEQAREKREARRAMRWHEGVIHDYPEMVVRKLGGSKPQNISHLNSLRGGANYLLCSTPPMWQSQSVRPLLGVRSMFDGYRRRREVRSLLLTLRKFLERDPARNLQTRDYRDDLTESLLDDFIQFTAEVRALPTGWTSDSACLLPPTHQAWLDPESTETQAHTNSDLLVNVAGEFANWLNAQLRDPLPLGDAEYLHWRRQALQALRDLEWEEVR